MVEYRAMLKVHHVLLVAEELSIFKPQILKDVLNVSVEAFQANVHQPIYTDLQLTLMSWLVHTA